MRTVPVGMEVVVSTSGAARTVRVLVAVTPLSAPDMTVAPAETPVASPLVLIAATAVFEEVHVTRLLRFCVLPSE
jgi:hypothetical protein